MIFLVASIASINSISLCSQQEAAQSPVGWLASVWFCQTVAAVMTRVPQTRSVVLRDATSSARRPFNHFSSKKILATWTWGGGRLKRLKMRMLLCCLSVSQSLTHRLTHWTWLNFQFPINHHFFFWNNLFLDLYPCTLWFPIYQFNRNWFIICCCRFQN